MYMYRSGNTKYNSTTVISTEIEMMLLPNFIRAAIIVSRPQTRIFLNSAPLSSILDWSESCCSQTTTT